METFLSISSYIFGIILMIRVSLVFINIAIGIIYIIIYITSGTNNSSNSTKINPLPCYSENFFIKKEFNNIVVPQISIEKWSDVDTTYDFKSMMSTGIVNYL